MRFRPLLPLLAVLAACSTSPDPEGPSPSSVSAGPEGTLIRVGEVQEGSITFEDPDWGDRGGFDLYRFQASEGQRLLIEMRSDEFDTYLVVGDKSGGIFNPITQDDDGGGDYDARIRFVAPASGTFWLLAQAYGDGTGSYVLSLNEMAEPRNAQVVRVDVGETVDGELTDDDAFEEFEEKHFDLYSFEAQEGQRYSITMRSPDFDSYVIVGRGTTDDFEEVTRNDDSGGNTDARVVLMPSESGTYSVRATSFDGTSIGAYSLTVDELGSSGPLVVGSIAIGDEVSGMLDEDDQVSDDGSFYDLYTFRGREGQRISITMSSNDLDSFVELGEGTDEFWGEHSDDDSGGGLDARITTTLWRSGEFTIRANALYPEETGSYTIAIEELPEPGPVQVRAITLGQTLEGELTPSDAMLDDESYYDVYTFRANAGDRVSITLRSDDFDSYLSFGSWDGDDVDITDSDDDSGGGLSGLDSQIQLTIPSSGTYGLQVNSLSAGETGSYTITLEEQ